MTANVQLRALNRVLLPAVCVWVQVWDPRVRRGEGLAVRACTSHTDWVSAIAWHPTSGGLAGWLVGGLN